MIVALVGAATLACTVHTALARVDVHVEFDKTFNFKDVRTWGWNPAAPGEVKMARTREDDPDAMKARAEPIILDAVASEIARRGLTRDAAAPDLTVTYYLLLTTNFSAQTIGQFLPATTGWGLPPFAPATQSLTMMNQGSLVLDLSAQGTVVWRGLAQSKIKVDADEKRREALLRESVRDLLRRYPPRQ
jgi:hypothetical protein